MLKQQRVFYYLILNTLCTLDSLFTLHAIKYLAAKEINPIMDFFLKEGSSQFFWFKCIYTLVLSFPLLHTFNKNKISRFAIQGLCIVYTILVGYELTLYIAYLCGL